MKLYLTSDQINVSRDHQCEVNICKISQGSLYLQLMGIFTTFFKLNYFDVIVIKPMLPNLKNKWMKTETTICTHLIICQSKWLVLCNLCPPLLSTTHFWVTRGFNQRVFFSALLIGFDETMCKQYMYCDLHNTYNNLWLEHYLSFNPKDMSLSYNLFNFLNYCILCTSIHLYAFLFSFSLVS